MTIKGKRQRNRCRQGAAVFQMLLVVAVSAIIMIGVAQMGNESADRTFALANRAMNRGGADNSSSSVPEIALPTGNRNGGGGNPSERRNQSNPTSIVDTLNKGSQKVLDALGAELTETVDQVDALSQEALDTLANEWDESVDQMEQVSLDILREMDRGFGNSVDPLNEFAERLLWPFTERMRQKGTMPPEEDPFNRWLRARGIPAEYADAFTNGLNRIGDDPDTIANIAKDLNPALSLLSYGFDKAEDIKARLQQEPPRDSTFNQILRDELNMDPTTADAITIAVEELATVDTLGNIRIPGYTTITEAWRNHISQGGTGGSTKPGPPSDVPFEDDIPTIVITPSKQPN